MAILLYIKHDTAANWTSEDPTLEAGQCGYETDTGLLKIGDGATAWTSLPYFGGQGKVFDLSAATTLTIIHQGGVIRHPAADDNARTFTIPANSSVAYPVGTAIAFINEINTVTIAITTDTLVWGDGDTGGTGSRTLAPHGVATAIKVAATRWYISGTGLS